MQEFICENISVNAEGHLCFAGQDTAALAAHYGTPLYLMDEDRVRRNMRVYADAFRRCFGPGSRVLYACKANCFRQICRIAQEEGLGLDVVSAAEIHTAKTAGFDMARAYYHSNVKTDADIRFAMDCGVGCFVVDGEEELRAIDAQAQQRGIRQKLLLRLTPGIDPHTYAAVDTGRVDSKFGTAIETGQAEALTALALSLPGVDLAGFHCHVGSMVFAEDVFERASAVMLEFIAMIAEKYGFLAKELDLGGGYGVPYVAADGTVDVAARIADVAAVIHGECARLGIAEPAVVMEPGRSIVADAGMTLYTVAGVKRIPGYKNYVAVDGGMSDNPRYALYGSQYVCYAADKMDEPYTLRCDLVGRCCESGDVIQPKIMMPESIRRGDLAAVCTTGAYNYSMASNYNRIPRPPIVMLRGGESYVAVRRETPDDLVALDN